VTLLESGRLRPRVAKEYPLREIGAAQEAFLSKRYAGKIVLVPPSLPGAS
jgi:NADPH:quinone reductase-like Zn-dependent oxidoreductase